VSQEVLDALGTGDGTPLRNWLTGALAAAMQPEQVSALAGLGRWNDTRGDDSRSGTALAGLRNAVRLTAGEPVLSALLALYVRHECNAAWEVSWDHGPIRTAIEAAEQERSLLPADTEAWARSEPAWALLRLLDREMLVESAAASGVLATLSHHAGLAAAQASAIAALCRSLPPDAVVSHVAEVAYRESCYYLALAGAAQAADEHVRTGDRDLGPAIDALVRAEAVFADDEVCRSELRAHRASLEALETTTGQPRLHIGAGSVVYVYPFGLRGVTAGRAVEALRTTGHLWTLAGLAVVRVAGELPLNDIWNGNDPLQRLYAGAAAFLPDILLPDEGLGRPHQLTVEVRLTELGNHCVRIEAPLRDANPQALYAALLRAAPEAADLRELGLPIVPAVPGAEPQWGRLTDLATEICADLCSQFTQHAGVPEVQVSTRGGTYHVVTRVQEAGAADGPSADRTTPVSDPEELLGLVGGAVLSHPVRHGVSAVAEWVRYPAGAGTRIDAPGMVDDLVIRTENTTTIACPTAPSYMIDPFQEAAEFVATLDGLFAGWHVELADHYYRITREMKQLSLELGRPRSDDGWDATDLDRRQRELEAAQHEMQVFVMASRLRLMFITAPSLVTSPVIRTTLDHLLDAAGFEKARADFVGTVEDVVGDRAWTLIDTSVRRRQVLAEERQREETARSEAQREAVAARGRRRMDILLAGVTAIGISGILSILQAGYDLKGWLSAALAASAVLTAAGAGAITHRLTAPVPVVASSSVTSAANGDPLARQR
jgi:hypothetical protein